MGEERSLFAIVFDAGVQKATKLLRGVGAEFGHVRADAARADQKEDLQIKKKKVKCLFRLVLPFLPNGKVQNASKLNMTNLMMNLKC